MDKKIMEHGNLTLERAEEVFKRLGIFEDFKKFMKSDNITHTVDTAFSACMSVLEQMTSVAPKEVKELAENNLKGFLGSKESFVSDFESNFKRIIAENLLIILDLVHDEESVKEFIKLEMVSADETTQTQKTAKQIVDQMIMNITKEYVSCTYYGYIPKGVSDASQYVLVTDENGEKVIVPRNVLQME